MDLNSSKLSLTIRFLLNSAFTAVESRCWKDKKLWKLCLHEERSLSGGRPLGLPGWPILLWWLSPGGEKPWRIFSTETCTCPQTIWSSTKNLTSLAVAMLVDQGYLNFSDRFDILSYGSSIKFWTSCFHRISQHWPEFGQCGKAGITVADMLRHEGGLSTIAAKLDIQDWWLSWSFKRIKDSLFQQTASQRTCGATVWRKSSRKSCHTGLKIAGENTTQSQEVSSLSL